MTSGWAAALLVIALGAQRAAGAEIIDRTLAVVGGEVVLLSDANAAVKFGLIDVPAIGDEAGLRAALNALVDRQLQLFEVNRYLPPEPAASAIDARVDAIRARLGEAGFRAALAETGMAEAQVRSRIRDNLRIDELPRAALRRGAAADRRRSAALLPRQRGDVHEERRTAAVRRRPGGGAGSAGAGAQRRADRGMARHAAPQGRDPDPAGAALTTSARRSGSPDPGAPRWA